MEILPLVPAPVVVFPEEGLVDDGVGEGTAATEVLSVQVGAAIASGKMVEKRESVVKNMTEEGS